MPLRTAIPVNLRMLWAEEDRLVDWAEGFIAAETYLVEHLDLIESYMDCVEMLRRAVPSGNRHHAIGGLFLRQFDSFGHGLRAAVSGNYTGCAMYARDLIETEFLIDYLLDERSRPEQWLTADPKTVRDKFGADIIRKALDKRDGFTEKKRKARFDMLSARGSHPTPLSLNLKRDGAQMLHGGPLKQSKLLEACIQELARAAASGGGRLVSYCNGEIPNGRHMASRLALTLQRTYEKYLN